MIASESQCRFDSALIASDGHEVSFWQFAPHERPDFFDDYLRLKYQIFVRELDWRGLALDRIKAGYAAADPFDFDAQFVIARRRPEGSVGVARGSSYRRGAFPHEILFARHLDQPAVQPFRERLDRKSVV